MNKLLQLLQITILQTIRSKYLKWCFGSSLLSYFASANIINYFDPSIIINWQQRLLFPLAIISCFFFAYLSRNLWRLFHQKYVDSIYSFAIEQRLIISESSKAYFCNDNVDFIKYLESICNNAKKVFDKLTSTSTSISIKIVTNDQDAIISTTAFENLPVKNICRDSKSRNRDTDLYKSQNHTLMGNTAYSYLITNLTKNRTSRLYYVNNNIKSSKDYLNSSTDAYANGVLPYNSEIVCPIYVKKSKEENFNMYGFLCIDSPQTNAFADRLGCEVAYMQSICSELSTAFYLKLNNQDE